MASADIAQLGHIHTQAAGVASCWIPSAASSLCQAAVEPVVFATQPVSHFYPGSQWQHSMLWLQVQKESSQAATLHMAQLQLQVDVGLEQFVLGAHAQRHPQDLPGRIQAKLPHLQLSRQQPHLRFFTKSCECCYLSGLWGVSTAIYPISPYSMRCGAICGAVG